MTDRFDDDEPVIAVGDSGTADGTETAGIDWGGLWTEFGFDTPGVDGRDWISTTQLRAALDCSDQDVAGDLEQRIQEGVEDGPLHELTAEGETGETILRGYIHTEVRDGR